MPKPNAKPKCGNLGEVRVKIKKKIILIVLGVVFFLALFFLNTLIQFKAFLPHKKIEIILPFDEKYDFSTTLIPMGEKIYHPDSPLGHPGIDFGGEVDFPFIASADGTITKMNHGSSDGIDIYLESGFYSIVYKEMDESRMFVKIGDKVKKGDKIAMPNPKAEKGETRVHYSTHWEFASISPVKDRYCPVNYFTQESKTRIEKIWDKMDPNAMGGMKAKYPNICSGGYEGREEK